MFLLLLFSFHGIEAKKSVKNKQKVIDDYEIYVNEIINEFSKEMKEKYGFICIGDGGRMPYDVETIFVKFQVYQRVNIEQTRKLEIMATKRLQELVNNHDKIKPFLREHPFGTERCQVFLSFSKNNNNYYTDGSIAYVFQARGDLHYYSTKTDYKETKNIYSESFEKAKKIVENEMNSEKK